MLTPVDQTAGSAIRTEFYRKVADKGTAHFVHHVVSMAAQWRPPRLLTCHRQFLPPASQLVLPFI